MLLYLYLYVLQKISFIWAWTTIYNYICTNYYYLHTLKLKCRCWRSCGRKVSLQECGRDHFHRWCVQIIVGLVSLEWEDNCFGSFEKLCLMVTFFRMKLEGGRTLVIYFICGWILLTNKLIMVFGFWYFFDKLILIYYI